MEDLSVLEQATEPQPSPVAIENVPLKMLNIALANPGPGYQRDAYITGVNKIAKNFDWDMFDPLLVSIRKDGPRAGELFIVDGQHRYLAASKIFPDTQEVPCMLVSMTYDEEAARFARQGENRRGINSRDLFRARIEARDPIALDVKRVVEEGGFRLATVGGGGGHNDIAAVHAVYNIYTRLGKEILALTLYVIQHAYPPPTASRCEARIITGLAHFLYHFPVAKIDRLIEKLATPEGHPKRIMQNAAMYSVAAGHNTKGNPAVSRAILDQYNKNMSIHRLDWDLTKYREAAIKRG